MLGSGGSAFSFSSAASGSQSFLPSSTDQPGSCRLCDYHSQLLESDLVARSFFPKMFFIWMQLIQSRLMSTVAMLYLLQYYTGKGLLCGCICISQICPYISRIKPYHVLCCWSKCRCCRNSRDFCCHSCFSPWFCPDCSTQLSSQGSALWTYSFSSTLTE